MTGKATNTLCDLSAPGIVTVSEAIEQLRHPGPAAETNDRGPSAFAFDGIALPLAAICWKEIDLLGHQGVCVSNAADMVGLGVAGRYRVLDGELNRIEQALAKNSDVVIARSELLFSQDEKRFAKILCLGDKYPKLDSGNISYIYSDTSCFQHPFFSKPERMQRYRRYLIKPGKHDGLETPGAFGGQAFEARILSLIQKHFGSEPGQQLIRFRRDLSKLLSDSGEQICQNDQFIYIEPSTGLQFLPRAEPTYRAFVDNGGTRLSVKARNPIEFLRKTYQRYIGEGLLYSGHLSKSDPGLYQALKNSIRTYDKYETVTELFQANGVLTPFELVSPPPNRREQVKIINTINALMIGENMAEGMLRGNVARLRRLASNNPA